MGNENETTAISTVITQNHLSIGDTMLSRVRDMIGSKGIHIKKYGIEDNGSTYSPSTETITLQINDRVSISIYLYTSK
jgi:hypothetical protein